MAGWSAKRFLIRSGCCRVSAWSFPLSIPANCLRESIARYARSSLRARRRPRKRLSKYLLLKYLVLKHQRLKLPKNETLLEPRPVGDRLLCGGTRTDSAFRGLPEDFAASGGRRNCGLLARSQHC